MTTFSPATALTAYLDCFSGISGDMFLAALIHAGHDQDHLHHDLASLGLEGVEIHVDQSSDQGIACCRARVESMVQPPLCHLSDILAILEGSSLEQVIREQATAVFRRLAEAEARVHGLEVNQVHLHEIGAVDTIVDVVGVISGLHHLGVRRVVCSPLPWTRGFVNCAHGRLPLPAPAVCELLRGLPVQGVASEQELVTPTGAALIATLAQTFGPLPPMRVQSIGYGGGTTTLKDRQPNLLRLIIGQETTAAEAQRVDVIETQLDDWNSEGFPYLCERLLEAGALDVSLTPLLMKKGRPGQLLRVLSSPAHAHALKELILSETTAIGLRFHQQQRLTLERRPVTVTTPWGTLQAKEVRTPQGWIIYPEYEVCREVARAQRLPLQEVYRAVSSARKISTGQEEE